MQAASIEDVVYTCANTLNTNKKDESIQVIGLDTEAYRDGQVFMLATSLGDVFRREEIPACFFSRKYIQKNFVAYNLKYDEGAILQFLTPENLRTLWETHKVEQDGFIIKSIPKKCLSIHKKGHSVHIYDMYNFYTGSLNENSKKYLGMKKLESDVESYTPEYVNENWDEISCYCFKDAFLVGKLGELLIKRFEGFGIFPRKLYSTAYISYQYFYKNCNYPTVKRFWNEDKGLLDYAMKSYNGGKFEVTEKGPGYYYEYDLVSAYPAQIAKLAEIENARIVWSNKYRRQAWYGFLDCTMKIPNTVFSPVAVKCSNVNIYPTGEFRKVITKPEYEYLIKYGADITIHNAVYLHIDDIQYPFEYEIKKLTDLKHKYKESGNKLDYMIVKILMNSLYGKFCQLIKQKDHFKASTCWNPILASYITAKTRIQVSEMQQLHPEVIAVHTDSLISNKPLSIEIGKELGEWDFECEGPGVIVGSGVYQIGDKVRLRGLHCNIPLIQLIDTKKKYFSVPETRVYTWSEVAFHNWDKTEINHFVDKEKDLSCDFDRKRIWIDDVKQFRHLLSRNVRSLPIDAALLDFL